MNVVFNKLSAFPALLIPLFLAACAVGPDYKLPDIPLPVQWFGGNETSEALADAPKPQPIKWWENFNDPALNAILEQSFAKSLDIREAEARLREVRAAERLANASLLPQIDGFASAERRRSSGSGGSIRSGGINNLYEAGFDASWEIDIFGGTRREAEAAEAQTAAAERDVEAARLSFAAEVARNYLQYRLNQTQMSLAEKNAIAQGETARITEARFREGVEGNLELSRAQAQLASTRAQIPLYAAESDASLYRLEFLAAELPGSLKEQLGKATDIPFATPAVALDTPLDVIRRRPDVQAAERRLAAATALQGAAFADFFPRLTLSGLLGFESGRAGDLLRASSKVWSGGGSILLPLLDFGRIRANVNIADARQEQAYVQYERTLRAALQEVETAISAYLNEAARREELLQSRNANATALDISRKQYREGIISQLDVLDAQRSLYSAENALADSTAAVGVNLVRLYKALGAVIASEDKRSE